MLKRDIVFTHLLRGTALVLAVSIAGIAQAGPTKGDLCYKMWSTLGK